MRLSVDVVKEGTFRCDWQFSPDKCGLNADLPGTRDFKYEVRVRAHRLDAHGFGLDNRVITRYFAEHFRDDSKAFVSCERMALDAAKHFYGIVGGERPRMRIRKRVKIWGGLAAHLDRDREERRYRRALSRTLPLDHAVESRYVITSRSVWSACRVRVSGGVRAPR